MNVLITIRIIQSFEYRLVKNLILKNVNVEKVTTEDLVKLVQNGKFTFSKLTF